MASHVQPIRVAFSARSHLEIAPVITTLALSGQFPHVSIDFKPLVAQPTTFDSLSSVAAETLRSAQDARRTWGADLGICLRQERLSLLTEDKKSKLQLNIALCVSVTVDGPIAFEIPSDCLPSDVQLAANKEAGDIVTKWAQGRGGVPADITYLDRFIRAAVDRVHVIETNPRQLRLN